MIPDDSLPEPGSFIIAEQSLETLQFIVRHRSHPGLHEADRAQTGRSLALGAHQDPVS